MKLLTFENVVKFFVGAIMCSFTVAGLYYAIDKRMALMEQKIDYIVENYKEKEIEAKVQLAELKTKDEQQTRDLAEVKGDIIRIFAVLPKRIQLENEKD